MKIDLLNVLYTALMILLAFAAAIVITKTVSKYFKLDEKVEEEEKDKDKTKKT
ncbi:hypothetical protein MNB_SV-8-805 [hydrothermal vent metagenome]|uniref:Uncharacterized protein n=1 Tax=hydrothermal vent metagenome TaxID=652676 RepID=A0A1W1BEE3_9ZZZZ